MTTEILQEEMYEGLIDLDQRLHFLLSQVEVKKKKSLKELQQEIALALPEEIEDTTALIREGREKAYGEQD